MRLVTFVTVVVCAASLLGAGLATAQSSPAGTSVVAQAPDSSKAYMGAIEEVDASKNTLKLTGIKEEFQLTAGTKMPAGWSIDKLKKGQKVTVIGKVGGDGKVLAEELKPADA